jgi:hypothetical protein
MLSLEDFLDEINISSAEDFEDEFEEDALAFKIEDHLEANLWMDEPDFITSTPSTSDSSLSKKTMVSNINEAIELVQKFNSENQKYFKVCTDNWNQESILKLHSNLKGLKEVYILDNKINELKKRLSIRKERSDERIREETAHLL